VTADNTLKGNIPPVIGSMKGDSVRCNIWIITNARS
jgi:hypothetical protein